MKSKKVWVYIEILVTMLVFQLLLYLGKTFIMPPNINLLEMKMFTMGCMMILAVLVVILAKSRKTKLSVFPEKFSWFYIVLTMIFIVLFASTPMNYIKGFPAVAVLFYGSVVTPIYEELLFRGYIWNRLETLKLSGKVTYFITAALFGLWHVGYMIPNLVAGDWLAVGSKVLIGLVFGLILGAFRYKTKNCYSTMLIHGIMNIFL